MRLLLTSDLHRDGNKLLWLLDEAPEHDALLVAGDLLDIFSSTAFIDQKSGTTRWREEILNSGKSFAWCSGNHDFFQGDRTPKKGASPLWMRESLSTKSFVTDGESRLLRTSGGDLAITTIPYPLHVGEIVTDGYRTTYPDFVKSLLSAGAKLRETYEVPWIVLNHEPPARTQLAINYETPEADFARKIIEDFQPDFSLHGHIHDSPTANGGSWIWQNGKTTCFNAGQSLPGEPLHHVLLEWSSTDNWTATWHGSGQVLTAEGTMEA